ncbi:DNA-directed DNA polymerase [Malassezia cuniculi]|uniref:DNA polymerase n=1 Tax=Malassezia cuniculi TaxID=948313 RepID=A0AAF0J6C2_9BASI|nr:DNA-directed DNA polymerase [Malassezia cuniculi]
MRVVVAHVEYGLYRGDDGKHTPIFHVHGATPEGTRCCVHVHGVYPYFYIDYTGKLEPEAVRQATESLRSRLDGAIGRRIVVAIHLCKGTPFYGFHERHSYYLKVSYSDPYIRTRLAGALESGTTGRVVQPYEMHIPYELQLMSDFGIAGCAEMDIENISFRRPCPKGHVENNRPRLSTAPLEVDVDASHILNRKRAGTSDLLVPSLRILWEQDAARRRKLGVEPAATPQREQRARAFPWLAEQRYAEKLANLRSEAVQPLGDIPTLDRWVPWAYDTPELFFKKVGADVIDQSQRAAPATPIPSVPESQSETFSFVEQTPIGSLGLGSDSNSQPLKFAPSACSTRVGPLTLPPPPTPLQVRTEVAVEHVKPHYSDPNDVPRREIPGAAPARLANFDTMRAFEHWGRESQPAPRLPRLLSYTYAKDPPHPASVRPAGQTQESKPQSQLTSQTSEPLHLAVLALEVIATASTYPDPEHNEVAAVVYALQDDVSEADWRTGALVVGEMRLDLANMRVRTVSSELELISLIIDLVRAADPEILVGYDLARGSFGYLDIRAAKHGIDLCSKLGRIAQDRSSDALRISGRHLIDASQAIKRSVPLTQYTLEHVANAVLHERTPSYTFATLSAWMSRAPSAARAIAYMARRTTLVLRILDRCDIIPRAAETARICGLDLTAALTRGSQFRVESMLLRIAKPLSYVFISPSRSQVAKQRAAESIPLVMEPQARMYSGPVAVLDFQSLYPSMIIAYNLCYSTCLGHIEKPRLGVTGYARRPGILDELGDDVSVSPNGMLFVRSHVRQSLLARMLSEVLSTRVMVRSAPQGTPAFERRQHARQLSLKLLANVTYGYAGASFSGRMPCVELADAIVQSGRETLEHAISWISHSVPDAQVVYGDTDSLFVHLPGRTVKDAFAIGHHIAESITQMNPDPVRLRLEKIYDGCVLLAKKRYAGYMYATPTSKPTLDVKGLETVRRDGNIALQRLEEACLRMLFVDRDLSAIKRYCLRQWTLLRNGHVSPAHLACSKPVRLGTYATSLPPPGAVLAARRMHSGHPPPLNGERVPFLIANMPGSRLADRAIAPDEVSENSLDTDYYIRRMMVPPLERILGPAGADVAAWYSELPRPSVVPSKRARDTLFAHYAAESCVVCNAPTNAPLCADCVRNPETAVYSAAARLHRAETRQLMYHRTCAACASFPPSESPPCVAYDCPIVFAKSKTMDEVVHADRVLKHALSSVSAVSTDAWEW